MQVTPAPMWESLLLEAPWPLILALGWLAVVAGVMANRRQNIKLLWLAGGLALAAAGVGVLAWAVETDREQIVARTHELIAHTAPLDIKALGEDLAPGARLIGPSGEVWLEREAMLSALERAGAQQRLHDQSIRRVTASSNGAGRGLSELALTTRLGDSGEFPIPTVWLLSWERDSDGDWRVSSAQWLNMRGAPPAFGVWR